MRKLKLCYLVLTMAIVVLSNGCLTKNIANRNQANGHQLGVLFRLHDQAYSDPAFPTTLADLEKRLRRVGFETTLPKCECADGKRRDFIYIPGFESSDGNDWAFLFSPPEMDSNAAVVVNLDATAKVMTPAAAVHEMEKSRAFLEKAMRQLKGSP